MAMSGQDALTICVIIASLSGCHESSEQNSTQTGQEAQTLKNSLNDTLIDLEKEYTSKCANLKENKTDGKTRYDSERAILHRIVKARIGPDTKSLSEIGRSLSDPNQLKIDDTPFNSAIYCTTIEILADMGARDQLVELLSRRCPENIGIQSPIECFLTMQERIKGDGSHSWLRG